jgi:hypothetical protein
VLKATLFIPFKLPPQSFANLQGLIQATTPKVFHYVWLRNSGPSIGSVQGLGRWESFIGEAEAETT